MSDKNVSVEKRLDVLEARVNVISEGLNDILTQLAKIDWVEEVEKEARWDPTKIKWREAEGIQGPYQRYPLKGEKVESTSDYHDLINDLKKHDGKLSRDGFFYWLFTDHATIGRKRRK